MTDEGGQRGGTGDARIGRRVPRTVIGLAAAIVILAVVGFLAIARMIDTNKGRELDAWYRQLGLVADSRAAAVDDWLGSQKDAISAVAGNSTVQFFMTELAFAGSLDKVTDADARLQILKNYLLFSAEQTGFTAPPEGVDIPANVERKARAGIAILTPGGKPVVETPWTPRIAKMLGDLKAMKPGDEPRLIGPFKGETGESSLAIVAPIAAFEGGGTGKGAVGFVVAVRLLGNSLAERLHQPGDQTATGRSYLVRREGDRIRYMAGAEDVPAAVLPGDADRLAAAFAAAEPGVSDIRANYLGTRVLVTGRTLTQAPWVLVRTVAADEALGDAEARARALLVIFALVLVSLVGAVLLLWRHGASVRVAAAARRQAALTDRLERLTAFLRTVTDSQPTAITALDADGHFRFVNRLGAEQARMIARDMIGKTISAVIGAARGRGLEKDNAQALEAARPVSRIRSFDDDEGERIVKSDHIPIEIPDGIAGDTGGPGVLMVLEDVTQLVTERERREHTLRQLVTTLATVIDGRDPYAARHSRMVAEVAEAIAEDMGLDDVTVETAEIAGALMNLGKVLVPRELLTRGGEITSGELDTIRGSILKSAELLKGVSFDGPVVEAINQVQAHWDGSGVPVGLGGEDILISARIVAVANAFVGMISARAYRDALPMDEVIRLLLGQVGTVFDRRPVAALVNYLDNRGGRAKWEAISRNDGQAGDDS